MGFVCFLVYLAGTYLYPAELLPELAPYRITFWAGVVGLAVMAPALFTSGQFSRRALPIALVGAFVFSMMLSSMWADNWPGAPLYVLQIFGPALTPFLLAIWNVNSLRRFRITGGVLVLLCTILVAQGVAAYHFGFMQDQLLLRGSGDFDDEDMDDDDTDTLVELEIAKPPRIRALGQLNDPNDLALVLVTALPFLGLAWRRGRVVRNAFVLGIPAAFLVYGIYLTRSRGGLLGTLVVCFVGLASRVSRTKALAATAVMGALLLSVNFTGGREVSTSEESAAGRINAWAEGIEMLRSNPLLGVGFKNFTEHNELTAHNSFVLCFAELGVVGYFFWLALLVTAVLQMRVVGSCANHGTEGDELRRQASILVMSFSGMMTAAFFLSRSYNPILYLFVGLAFALYGIARQSGHPVRLPSAFGMGRLIVAVEFVTIMAMYVLVRANRMWM